MIMLNKS